MRLSFACLSTLVTLLSLPAYAAESFKLYKSPHQAVDSACDAHTVLTFDAATSRLELHDALLGTCDLHVPRNSRAYRVVWRYVGICDETVYITAPPQASAAGEGKDSAIFTDFRSDGCPTPPPARIMIEETRDGQLGLLYSEN